MPLLDSKNSAIRRAARVGRLGLTLVLERPRLADCPIPDASAHGDSVPRIPRSLAGGGVRRGSPIDSGTRI